MTASAGALAYRPASQASRPRGRARLVALLVALGFAAVAVQVVRLALGGLGSTARVNVAEPIIRVYARPDIVDRKGRLLASDVAAFSLFADPAQVIDVDEASERVAAVLSELDPAELRAQLADRSRRFVWIKRGLPPAVAQRIHDLGLPGLAFRTEPRRIYPQGRLAGHVLGHVNADNVGIGPASSATLTRPSASRRDTPRTSPARRFRSASTSGRSTHSRRSCRWPLRSIRRAAPPA